MPARLRFLLQYFISWLFFFGLARALFLLGTAGAANNSGSGLLARAFWYGARMDASMAAYLTLPVSVFLLASVFAPFFRRAVVYQVYTLLLLLPVMLLVLADIPMFKIWGFRIDATPLKYLSNPREAWASVSHLPVWAYALGFVLLYAGACLLAKRLLARAATPLQQRERWYLAVTLLLTATSLLIIPMRGGLQQTPLNQSSVYFSSSNYANQAALNAPWNFLFGVVSESDAGSEVNPYNYMPAVEARRIVDSLPKEGTSLLPSFNSGKPNIILVIWESGTAKVVDQVVDGVPVTPGLNTLKKEGIWFSNAFASGDRTDKGVPAVLSAYPALPLSSIIRLPNKARKLATLPGLYRQQGYQTAFYYGGEPEFANLKSYLLGAGFDPLVQKSDFAAKDQNSKWGAHDGVVADRIISDISGQSQPFFITWLTLSSHEPFETPAAPAIRGSDDVHLFLNSLHYTDSVLYRFVRRCQQQPGWNNTIIAIVADHGHPLPETGSRLDNFRIPILLLGGMLQAKTVTQTVSQLDLAATLAPQMPAFETQRLFPFSHSLLSPPGRAFFTFNNGFGYVQDSNWVLYDNIGRRPIGKSPGAAPAMLRAGQALQQHTFQDYLDK
ncbi:MAG: LTA synthase family protein [Chitinophagaceae bacterium]|nr:MAG: LTA synthase family protein [Chitinophagaceae bacterium]